MQQLIDRIRERYELYNKSKIQQQSYIFFIFIVEGKTLEKVLLSGKILKEFDNKYIIRSNEIYEVKKYLVFISKKEAENVFNSISIDELRIII